MKYPLISIIIPIYNAANYLSKCIESILFQTFLDYECLLIDDGSNDGSSEICDSIVSVNPKFHVFHKPNGGVSSARNIGITEAKGEWLCFVDADDELETRYLGQLFDHISDVDLVVSGYSINGNSFYPYDKVYSGVEVADYCNNVVNRLYGKVPWGKLFRRSLIIDHQLFFDDKIRLGEDLVFNLHYLVFSKAVRTVNYAGYLYNTNFSNEVKYKLRLHEIEYVTDRIKEYETLLSHQLLRTVDLNYSKKIILAVYPYKDIMSFTNSSDYYSTYLHIFPNSEHKQFMQDEICSPIVRGLLNLTNCYRFGDSVSYYSICEYLIHNYKKELIYVTYPNKKLFIISLCLRFHLIKLLSLILFVDKTFKN